MKLLTFRRASITGIWAWVMCAVIGISLSAQALAPLILPIGNQSVDEDTTLSGVAITVVDLDENATNLTTTVSWTTNSTLFTANTITISGNTGSRTLTAVPTANLFGTETVSVVVTDSGGAAATNTFDIVVNPVEEAPTLTGVVNFSTTSTNGPLNIFSGVGLTDPDIIGYGYEAYHMTAEITSGFQYGDLVGELDYTGNHTNVLNALHAMQYVPNSAVLPINVNNSVGFKITLQDFQGVTNVISFATTNETGSGSVYAIDLPPVLTFNLSPNTINDYASEKVFNAGIEELDGGDVTVSLSTPFDPSHLLGNFSPLDTKFVGTTYFAEEFIKGISYVASGNVVVGTSNLVVRLTAVDAAKNTNTLDRSLTLVEVNDPPSINSVSTSLVFTDDSTSVNPFPVANVVDPDRSGTQFVQIRVTVDNPSLASFSLTGWSALMTPAEATALLRNGLLIPDPAAIAIGVTKTVTLTVDVRDEPGLQRSNSQCKVAITGVNGAPVIMLPSGFTTPRLVPPSDPRPFNGIWINDDEASSILIVTMSLDNSNKGTLTNTVAGFSQTSPGVYTFTGNLAAVSNMLDLVKFNVNSGFSFPAGAPGSTEFTLSAEDELGNTVTKYIQAILLELPRNILVTHSDDDAAVGSLRYALTVAAPNDVISFALPEYPATIRLNSTNALITLSKHVMFKGPGADMLTISGDSNGDDIADKQLFRVNATVTMEGITFAKGAGMFGGAFSVGPAGSLTLRSCVVRDSVGLQWGGAIDVDRGQLKLEQCLLQDNSTDSASGLGGGAVSLYTVKDCRFENTTFSGNTQGSVSGYGGGAIYAENYDAFYYLDVDIVHCTFTENRDEAAVASAVYANGPGTVVWPLNTIFSDEQGRNIEVDGLGDVFSLGGNICDDSTFTVLTIGGVPNAVFLLGETSDQTDQDVMLGPLTKMGGETAIHPLLAGSPAINNGTNGLIGVDQRGVFRDASPDCGSAEFNAAQRLLINEVQAFDSTNNFVELYIPRNAVATDLSGFSLWVDGVKKHDFTTGAAIKPGSGIVISEVAMPTITNVSVVAVAGLDLLHRGLLSVLDASGREVLSLTYNGDFVDLYDIAHMVSYPNTSITLSPQFNGFALLPHSEVGSGTDSPGADTDGRLFGAENASPVALLDSVLVGEDQLKRIDVLANDSDADGTDMVVVSGVPLLASGITPTGAVYQVAINAVTFYGAGVWYDPRSATNIQELAAGAEMTDSFMYRVEDFGAAPIEAVATFNGGTNSLITSAGHRLNDGHSVRIVEAGSYDGVYSITNVTDDSFVINAPYAGAVTNGRWVAQATRGGSSSNQVNITIIGANDFPVAGADAFVGTEEEVLRLLADPDLLGSAVVFDTDASFPVAVSLGATNLLVNDSDIDTDDNKSTLKVVGVLNAVHSITNYSGSVGDAFVTVESAAHGLTSGQTILISGYGGYSSYNGSQVVTVIDVDHFTIPVPYVDSSLFTGVWGRLYDGNLLQATSRFGGAVKLEIRTDRAETSILYNPLPSAYLNSLALSESTTDTFYYAVSDSHGALSIGEIDVTVTGLNETPLNPPDPDSISVLNPFIGVGQTIEDVISGLTVLDAAGSSAGAGWADVRVQVAGQSEADSVVISTIWVAFEDRQLNISTNDILRNDSDADTHDVLRVAETFTSALGVPIMINSTNGTVVYDAPASYVLDALAHNEMLIDSFKVVITDDRGGFVTNSVVLLVVGVNDAPVAVDDLTATEEDQVIELDPITFTNGNSLVWDTDVDVNGTQPDNVLWIIDTNNVTELGAAFSITNNHFAYDPSGSAQLDGLSAITSLTDTVEYTLTDQSFVFANDDVFRVEADGNGFVLDVLANDRNYNVRSGPLTFVGTGVPNNNGSVSTNGAGTALIYSPEINFIGDEVFTYTVRDANGTISRARVTVRVTTEAFNGHLQANADFFTVARGESVQLPILANDNTLPASGSVLSITKLSGTNGLDQVSISGDHLVFSQASNAGPFPYITTFSYEVSGGGSARTEATVQVQVVDRSDSLPTQDDHFHVASDSHNNFMDVIVNDSILPGTGTHVIDSIYLSPPHGTASIDTASNRLLYTPAAGYIGSDILGYKVVDTLGGDGYGTVQIMVGTPVVEPDHFVVPFNSILIGDEAPVELDVLANDRILPRLPNSLRITSISPSTSSIGSFAPASGVDRLVFTATEGATGSASFSYVVKDEFGIGSRALTGTLTVTIASNGVFANADDYYVSAGSPTVSLGVLANDRSLPERGRKLSILAIGTGPDAPNHGGTVQIGAANAELLYTPANGFAGEETFTYTTTDAYGTDAARVTVQVGKPVIAANDDAYSVYHEGTATPTFTLQVLQNDVLLPQAGGLLEIVGVGIDDTNGTNAPSQQGSVSISADAQTLVYTPNTNYTGNSSYRESFTYEVSDGTASRVSAKVDIDVLLLENDQELDRSRETNADRFSVERNSIGNVLPLLGNDGARPASTLSWSITGVSTPTFGGQVIISSGTVVYTPVPGFVGTDQFTYSISDGFGGVADAEVRVKVGDINLTEDRFTVISGTVSNALDVLLNDSILPAWDYELILNGAGATSEAGMVAVSSNAVYYTPASSYTGNYPYVETFEYTVLDDSAIAVTQQVQVLVIEAGSDRDTAIISIEVQGVNDLPVITGIDSPLATDDKTSIKPFPSTIVSDVDEWGVELQVVNVAIDDPAKGALTALGGFSDLGAGAYEMTGTPSEITAALTNLVYVPVENRITIGTNEVVSLSLSVQDPFAALPVTSSVEILVTPVNDLPVISGTRAGQKVYHALSIELLSSVTIDEVDDLTLQSLNVQVALDDASHGSLTSLGGFYDLGGGVYSATGMTAAAATTVLRGMVFEPTTAGRISSTNVSETTRFTISVDDGGIVATDDATTVDAYLSLITMINSPWSGSGNPEGFGRAVGTSRDVIAVGSPGRSGGGAVTLYARNLGGPEAWGELLTIPSPDATGNDEFGLSVAISGDTLVVGAPANGAVGAAYVFQQNQSGTNAWGLVAKLLADDGASGNRFGGSVAIDGDTIAVGAYHASFNTADSGAVYLFDRGVLWSQTQKIGPDDAYSNGLFGYSVALQGDGLVAGAPLDTEIGPNAGAAYTFERDGGVWSPVQKIFGDLLGENDQFGLSVDIFEDTIAVGSPLDSTGNSGHGAAFAFSRSLAGTWQLDRKLQRPVPASGELFGSAVSVDLGILAVGASGVSGLAGLNVGEVYVYDRNDGGSNQWGLIELFKSPDGIAEATFGAALAIDHYTLAVCSPGNAKKNTYPGTLSVFRLKFNNAPAVATPISDQITTVFEPFEFMIPAGTFADPDLFDQLAWSVQLTGGTWLSFDTATGVFSGTPAVTGRVDVVLIATDMDGLGATNAFSILTVPLDAAGPLTAKIQWKYDHFGDGVLSAPDTSGFDWSDTADNDSDNLSNIAEYVFGTDPLLGNGTIDHEVELVDSSVPGSVTLAYNRRTDDPSLTYVIITSTDLQTWEDASGLIQSESTLPQPDGMERVTVELDVADSSCFFRVQVVY